ncbi:MAG: dTDP-4-dehydrorhamnose 3,5-epimerase, partial [Acidobacteria bacterium]|nr:dTDP-4-dehydrorhamnose 3,5-epimerase [Acidobacteriota bacterium]
MRIEETELPEVLLLEPRRFADDRGFFMETYNESVLFAAIPYKFVQDNLSRSKRGVLRGLHFQEPNPQGKLVRCPRGALFDVAVDIRVGSPHFGKWVGRTLTEENAQMLWIPPGFAHGFCALTDDAELAYKCTAVYQAS